MSADKTTVIYDGECHFCIDQVERIKRMDRHNRFDYLPRQSPEFEKQFQALKDMNLEEGMRVITADGKLHVAADAVYQIAKRLPQTKLIAWLYCLPVCRQVARLIYRWIAANRKQLGRTCEAEVCKHHVHSRDEG